MNRMKLYYKPLVVGIAIGAFTTSFFFAHSLAQLGECEPVIDVQYKRTGKGTFMPETVVRRPVRDGERCLLAESGS